MAELVDAPDLGSGPERGVGSSPITGTHIGEIPLSKIVKYAVIDDYGDEWETGSIAFSSRSRNKCVEWAESENYHSASIVSIDENDMRQRVE